MSSFTTHISELKKEKQNDIDTMTVSFSRMNLKVEDNYKWVSFMDEERFVPELDDFVSPSDLRISHLQREKLTNILKDALKSLISMDQGF